MIISRAPFRISFVGGGSDLPAWFLENGGAVVSVAIKKYCYVTLRNLPPFFPHKYRVVYSKVELPSEIDQIEHPVVREALRLREISEGVEVHHFSDLPARSGIGSSSAFSVALLHALNILKGSFSSKRCLADEVIHFEQDILAESVGCQDQVAVTFGGLNLIEFSSAGFKVTPVNLNEQRRKQLESSLFLVYSGISRTASVIEGEKVQRLKLKESSMAGLMESAHEFKDRLENEPDLDFIGDYLSDSWSRKRELLSGITNNDIDSIYDQGLRSGALGGKLLGSGGGGFLAFYVPERNRERFLISMGNFITLPIQFDYSGVTAQYGERV